MYDLVYATNVSYVTNITAILTNIVASTNNSIYVGGQFDSINGTRRVGFARLNTDGTVDTSFLDTAYNQFAGWCGSIPTIRLRSSPLVSKVMAKS